MKCQTPWILPNNHIQRETKPEEYNLRNPVVTQDYTVSMSGGNDRGTYYASLGYNDFPGAPITTSIHVIISHLMVHTKLRIG